MGSGCPLTRGTRHPSPEPDLPLSGYPALPLPVLVVARIREFSCMEKVMALQTQDQRFPVASGHDFLPEVFSVLYILQFPNVMDLEWACFRSAVFALFRVQPS